MTFAAHELRRAVEADELVLLFHPQVDMRTGTAVAVEASLRWQHPEQGLLHAMKFVEAVPASGLAREYMRWIVRTAARQMAAWRAAKVRLERVAINTWPESLRAELVDDVLAAAADAKIPPAAIEVETCPEATYDDATLDVVRALRDAGVRTAWDDFGDGDVRYASLRAAAFDVVKVPVTFVLRSGPYDDAVVQAAVGFARAIGAVVVAEGVETVASRDRVRGLGCDVGQGYLWSRIVPGDRIPAAVDAITIDGARTA